MTVVQLLVPHIIRDFCAVYALVTTTATWPRSPKTTPGGIRLRTGPITWGKQILGTPFCVKKCGLVNALVGDSNDE
jgi:hypothetical protein